MLLNNNGIMDNKVEMLLLLVKVKFAPSWLILKEVTVLDIVPVKA